jgi:cell division protein FtsL
MTRNRTGFVSTRRRQMATAGAGAWGRNQNLTPFSSGQKLGPVANAVLIALLVALLGLLYLTQLTKTGSFSYEISQIDAEKSQLSAEQDNLKVENARLQSLNRIKNSDVAAAMTTPVEVTSAE